MLNYIRNYISVRAMQRTTENELYRLSDRELNDLGICRGDIASIARQTAGRGLV